MRRHFVFALGMLLVIFAVGYGQARAAATAIEGESLVAGARAQGGAVSVQPMAAFGRGWSGGAQLLWAAKGPKSTLQISIVAPAEAEYSIAAFFTRGPNYGNVNVEVNGAHLAAFDGFAERVARSERVMLGRARLARAQPDGPAHAGQEPSIARVSRGPRRSYCSTPCRPFAPVAPRHPAAPRGAAAGRPAS